MTAAQRESVMVRLNGTNEVEAFEAAKEIWQDADVNLEIPLIRALRGGRRPFNRAAAAFAMQIVSTPKTVRALETVVLNRSERPRVRGEAAEALAHSHRKKSHDVVLRGLLDPSKEVRFWCAFSLGEMAERRALPRLRDLVVDRRVVKGFHSVSKEAIDAIENIERGNVGHRRGSGCVFCRRSFQSN